MNTTCSKNREDTRKQDILFILFLVNGKWRQKKREGRFKAFWRRQREGERRQRRRKTKPAREDKAFPLPHVCPSVCISPSSPLCWERRLEGLGRKRWLQKQEECLVGPFFFVFHFKSGGGWRMERRMKAKGLVNVLREKGPKPSLPWMKREEGGNWTWKCGRCVCGGGDKGLFSSIALLSFLLLAWENRDYRGMWALFPFAKVGLTLNFFWLPPPSHQGLSCCRHLSWVLLASFEAYRNYE